MNAETVTNQDIPLNLGKQAVMEVAQTHNNSIVSISPNLKSDLWSNDSYFQAKLTEVDLVINNPSSSQSVAEKIMLNSINIGKNLGESSLNATLFRPAIIIRVLELMQKTLADPKSANHVPNPTTPESLIQVIDENVVQPSNLRSGKRIMCQPNPSVAKTKTD